MISRQKKRLLFLLVDFLSTNLALLLFNIFRYYLLPTAYRSFATLSDFLTSFYPLTGQIIFPFFMLGLYWLSGVYSARGMQSRTSGFLTTLATAAIGSLSILFVALINDLSTDRTRDYLLFLMLFVLLFLVVYIPRLIITQRILAAIRNGDLSFNTLIVGYSSIPQLFPRQLQRLRSPMGFKILGLVDSEDRSRYCTTGTDLPITDLHDIAHVVKLNDVSRIIVIPHPGGWDKTLTVLNALFSLDIPIFVAAHDLPHYLFSTSIDSISSEPLIDITRSRMPQSKLNIKRTFDVLTSSVILLLAAIPVALMALAVKLDSPGPAFYFQQRVGLRKRTFRIIKLRTMVNNAESDNNPALSHPDDPRITRIGRILRKYRLDELPQVVNVIRGDMSLVGPRPERPYYMNEIIRRDPSATLIHRVRPGITSLGMVKFGYASTIEQMMQRIQFEKLYLDNISLLTDLKIILHTFHTVLSGSGV